MYPGYLGLLYPGYLGLLFPGYLGLLYPGYLGLFVIVSWIFRTICDCILDLLPDTNGRDPRTDGSAGYTVPGSG